MKIFSSILLPAACLLVAATSVAADFDRDLWEEVPAAMYNHGVGSVRRDLASQVDSALDKRAKWMFNNHVGTWYSGKDLQNPACFPGKAPRIRDDMKIAAIKNHRKCFLCIQISVTKAHPRRSDLVLRSIKRRTIAKIIDYCPSCDMNGEKVNNDHIDLSKGAFTDLAPIVDGEVPISWKPTRCFKSKYWPLTPGKKY